MDDYTRFSRRGLVPKGQSYSPDSFRRLDRGAMRMKQTRRAMAPVQGPEQMNKAILGLVPEIKKMRFEERLIDALRRRGLPPFDGRLPEADANADMPDPKSGASAKSSAYDPKLHDRRAVKNVARTVQPRIELPSLIANNGLKVAPFNIGDKNSPTLPSFAYAHRLDPIERKDPVTRAIAAAKSVPQQVYKAVTSPAATAKAVANAVLSGEATQSTGQPIVENGVINWGNPESSADFFRADQALQELRPYVEPDNAPEPEDVENENFEYSNGGMVTGLINEVADFFNPGFAEGGEVEGYANGGLTGYLEALAAYNRSLAQGKPLYDVITAPKQFLGYNPKNINALNNYFTRSGINPEGIESSLGKFSPKDVRALATMLYGEAGNTFGVRTNAQAREEAYRRAVDFLQGNKAKELEPYKNIMNFNQASEDYNRRVAEKGGTDLTFHQKVGPHSFFVYGNQLPKLEAARNRLANPPSETVPIPPVRPPGIGDAPETKNAFVPIPPARPPEIDQTAATDVPTVDPEIEVASLENDDFFKNGGPVEDDYGYDYEEPLYVEEDFVPEDEIALEYVEPEIVDDLEGFADGGPVEDDYGYEEPLYVEEDFVPEDEIALEYVEPETIEDLDGFAGGGLVKKLLSQMKFKTEEGPFEVYDIIKDPNKVRGRASMFTVHKPPEGYVVRNAILPEEMRRQGIASEFYQRMNKESLANTGNPLRSSPPREVQGEMITELSPDAEALWNSFVNKGLAESVGERQYRFLPVEKADGGPALLEDEYPTEYMPEVGRQVMADGGFADTPVVDEANEPLSGRARMRNTAASIQPREGEEVRADGEGWQRALQNYRNFPVRPGEATVRPRDDWRAKAAAVIAGEGGPSYGSELRRRAGEALFGPTYGVGLTDVLALPTVIDAAQAYRKGNTGEAAITAATLGIPFAAAARKPIANAVRTARRVLTSPAGRAAAAGATGAAVMSPDDAKAGKLDIAKKIASAVIGHNSGLGSQAYKAVAPLESDLAKVAAQISARNKLLSPLSSDPEIVKEALRILETYKVPSGSEFGSGTYFKTKPPMAVSDVTAGISPLPGIVPHRPKQGSWEDFYNVGKGGSFLNVGGDRLNQGVLTSINGQPTAWAVKLHGGPKYMLEGNPGAVWANAPSHTTSFENKIAALSERGPVFGVYSPMGPTAVDSSVDFFNAMMSQIPGSKITKKAAKAFDAAVKKGTFVQKVGDREKVANLMKENWPGILNIKTEKDALNAANIFTSATHRADLMKFMEKTEWQKLGFPNVGVTRAAVSDPEFKVSPQNVLGGRIVKFDTTGKVKPSLVFEHPTYPSVSAGRYTMDVPLLPTQDVAPTPTLAILGQRTKSGEIMHPMSPDPRGRSSSRKMFTEQKQAQPINEEFIDSIGKALDRIKKYGYAHGGPVEERDGYAGGSAVVSKALRAIRELMEGAKDLPRKERMMVVHKTRPSSLELYEKLGGMPSPSTAVIKPSEPLRHFGNITLVGDPEKLAIPGARNPIFAADAYTPRMPEIFFKDDKPYFEIYNKYGEPSTRKATIQSILRQMKSSGIRGGENFGGSEGSIRSQITPEFRNVNELAAARSRLNSEAYKEAASKSNYMDIYRRMSEASYRHGPESSPNKDLETVASIARRYGGLDPRSIMGELGRNYNIDKDLASGVANYLKGLRDMPSLYFEGKPQRVVPLSDFSGALIPVGKDARDAADILNRQGVKNIEFFSPKKDIGDRPVKDQLYDTLIERFPNQQFAHGGPVEERDGYAGKGAVVSKALRAIREIMSKDDRAANLKKFMQGSKIINDETGEAIRLYHATPKTNIEALRAGGDNPELSGMATWLSPYSEKQPASHNVMRKGEYREGANVMPVYANIKTPLYLDTEDMVDWARKAYAKGSKEFPYVMLPEWREAIVKDGYDGIVFGGSKPKEYVTHGLQIGQQPVREEEIISFFPERQLKSATGNVGTFDPDIPLLSKADGGPVEEREGYAGKGKVVSDALKAALNLVRGGKKVFPKPERMFPEGARPPGGEYIDPATGEILTGMKPSRAVIGVTPDGKPIFMVDPVQAEVTGSPGKGSTKTKTNLYKKNAGWKWIDVPKGYENVSTLVSAENRQKHYFALGADFPKGVDLQKYPNEKSEPRLKPTTQGNVYPGNEVGKISVRGKEHPVYDMLTIRSLLPAALGAGAVLSSDQGSSEIGSPLPEPSKD